MATSTTEQDFFQIKENLKTYLRDQSEFVDYDFDGSAMSTLLDVMAFNTHYTALTANMSVNEMFLDTSQLRSNVVAHAKGLGYTTHSMRASNTTVNIVGASTSTTPLTLPRGTIFKSGGQTAFKFITLKDYSATPVRGFITFSNVDVYEGKLLTNSFTVSSGDQVYKIPNKAIDTTTLRVTVTDSIVSSTSKEYTLSKYLSNTLSTSEVYFLQESMDEIYEIYFGDSIIGKKLSVGNIIKIEYLKTSGPLANSIKVLTLDGSISGMTSPVVTVGAPTYGGANIESIDSIKKNAPFDYSAQNRAVTTDDYKTIIKQIYPNIDSISVWGGEDNNPPIYGKVFASIKPSSGATLTTTTKELIKNELKRYKVASIIPEIIDPDYMYILLNVTFKYNSGISNLTATELQTKVQSVVDSYNKDVLISFNQMYRNSNLTTLVDSVNTAIISCTIRHKVKKYITPILNTKSYYDIEFSNTIYNPHTGHKTSSDTGVIISNGFYITGNSSTVYFMEDDGEGYIKLFHKTSGSSVNIIDDAKFGTVDYIKGQIIVSSLGISGFTGIDDSLIFTVELDSYDIVPVRNMILQIESSSITPIEDSIESGTYSGNVNYKTTPSRL